MNQASDVQADIVQAMRMTEHEVQYYEDEGWLYLPGVLTRETAAALREEVLDMHEQAGLSRERLGKAAHEKDSLRQLGQYVAGSLSDRLINSPNMRQVACDLMRGPGTRYLPFTAVKAGGGGGQFHFHQDNQYTRHDGPSINIWVALNEMTPENGCLCMDPRTHLRGTFASTPDEKGVMHPMVPVPSKYLPVRMNAGDAVAFSRLTIHGSGPNTTPQPRIAYALQYHRDDTKWFDKGTGQWQLLKDVPRFQTAPVEKITRIFDA